ncbi:hypothetical protein D3C81_1913790 [compost metagenome]
MEDMEDEAEAIKVTAPDSVALPGKIRGHYDPSFTIALDDLPMNAQRSVASVVENCTELKIIWNLRALKLIQSQFTANASIVQIRELLWDKADRMPERPTPNASVNHPAWGTF